MWEGRGSYQAERGWQKGGLEEGAQLQRGQDAGLEVAAQQEALRSNEGEGPAPGSHLHDGEEERTGRRRQASAAGRGWPEVGRQHPAVVGRGVSN